MKPLFPSLLALFSIICSTPNLNADSQMFIIGKEVFWPSPRPGVRALAFSDYVHSTGLEMLCIYSEQSESDKADIEYQAFSKDNGKHWSTREVVPNVKKLSSGTWRRCVRSVYVDPVKDILIVFANEGTLPTDHPLEGMKHWRVTASYSRDGGQTLYHEGPIVQAGAEFTPEHPLPGVWLGKNSAMIGDRAGVPIRIRTGEVLRPVQITPLGPNGEYVKPTSSYTYHDSAVLIGKWNANDTLDWRLSTLVHCDPKLSTRGMLEPAVAEMPDGRILMVMRGSNDAKGLIPGYRWYAVSGDAGATWSKPQPWQYADGTSFFSPGSCSALISHSNGRVYWIGNISPANPHGNAPRYPLVIGEVDSKSLLLIKDSLRTIDDRGPNDPENLQISNFHAREDRETGDIVIHCSPIGRGSQSQTKPASAKPARSRFDWTADAYLYRVHVTSPEKTAPAAPTHRIYSELMNPREHPDDARKYVKPPDWNQLGNRTRFTTLRGFGMKDDRLVGFREELDKYVNQYDLGEIIWPAYPILSASNLDELADEIKKRDLFLFDLWGYVPGSGPGDYNQQFKAPPEQLKILESTLGERWLGMDVGEQDGRYIGGYAMHMTPMPTSRFEQYLNFHRHFERLCDDLGKRMTTLVSLNFGHYLIKDGNYSSIGAETAQALPNGQVYYSFIRGAGKQYGVPWFGNASVFNRWGWKVYGPPTKDNGPTKGTSLSLLKRLIYIHILYNCIFVGFESSWFDDKGNLSPIGKIQQSAQKWVRKHGQPGTMLTSVGLLLDFDAGWTFPRHLYTDRIYRVWGNVPYGPGDYLTDNVLNMIYPRYQDSSYYHDESGFISATPYGDSADCLLSDAESWLLERYPLLIVAGELKGGVEIREKLSRYIEAGGHLIITAGNLAKLPGGLAEFNVTGAAGHFDAGTRIDDSHASCVEDQAFALLPLALPANAQVQSRCGEMPAVVDAKMGKGHITVLASPFGVGLKSVVDAPIKSEVDKPLAQPFPLLKHVRATLDTALRRHTLFEVGDELSLIICRKSAGQYTLGVCNNTWSEKPLNIVSHCGPIESVEELTLDESEKTAVGYFPEGMENTQTGQNSKQAIAGGDVRIFSVRVRETNVETIPHDAPLRRQRGRILPLHRIHSIQEEILARPTFFEHFDGVLVDWTYLRDRDKTALQRETGWLRRQGLRVWIDLSPGINLFPDLRLVDNIKEEYEASLAVIDEVMAKMEIMGAHDLILKLHRVPENNFTEAQTRASMENALKHICKSAEQYNITVYIRPHMQTSYDSFLPVAELIKKLNAGNLKIAASTGSLLARKTKPEHIKAATKDAIGLWLVSTTERDIAGRIWNINAPIADSEQLPMLAEYLSLALDAPMALDAVYDGWDAEYRDIITLRRAE